MPREGWTCHARMVKRCVGTTPLNVEAHGCAPQFCTLPNCMGVLHVKEGCFPLWCSDTHGEARGHCHALKPNVAKLTARAAQFSEMKWTEGDLAPGASLRILILIMSSSTPSASR